MTQSTVQDVVSGLMDLGKENELIRLAFQIANESVHWTEALHAERENDGDRATLDLLEREAALMSLAMTYKSHRDVYYGLAEEEGDELP